MHHPHPKQSFSHEKGWQIAPVKTGRMQEVKVLYN